VSIPECQNSTRIKGTGMKKIAGLPAKFYFTGFHQNDWIPAGIRGALIRPQFMPHLRLELFLIFHSMCSMILSAKTSTATFHWLQCF